MVIPDPDWAESVGDERELSVTEASIFLRLSIDTVRRRIKDGTLKPITRPQKDGSRVPKQFLKVAHLRAYMEDSAALYADSEGIRREE